MIKIGIFILIFILVVFGTFLDTWGMGWKWIVVGLVLGLVWFIIFMRD